MMQLEWRYTSHLQRALRRRCFRRQCFRRRCFSSSTAQREIRDISELPDRISASFEETSNSELLTLRWPAPPRNVLLVRKERAPDVDEALVQFAKHIQSTYPHLSLVLEPHVAYELHNSLAFPVYTPTQTEHSATNVRYHEKVDLTATLGGDGTILRAASLFATSTSVPPIISFGLGSLGFLGEWKFAEHKRAFREVYVSGAPNPIPPVAATDDAFTDHPTRLRLTASANALSGWSSIRGKTLGPTRNSRVLLRNRLRVGLHDQHGGALPHEPPFSRDSGAVYALNEVLLHRGAAPHLSHTTILIGTPPHQRTLTTAIADGFLVSTPTGSTAYSLSAGGCIVHPLVPSLLLTPICPRSLSFRPLLLPANTPVTLRIDEANRGAEIEVSVDGVRRREGLRPGMEVRVVGEAVQTGEAGGRRASSGGVPCIVRSGGGGEHYWVGGLNGLLKFNFPFGSD